MILGGVTYDFCHSKKYKYCIQTELFSEESSCVRIWYLFAFFNRQECLSWLPNFLAAWCYKNLIEKRLLAKILNTLRHFANYWIPEGISKRTKNMQKSLFSEIWRILQSITPINHNKSTWNDLKCMAIFELRIILSENYPIYVLLVSFFNARQQMWNP